MITLCYNSFLLVKEILKLKTSLIFKLILFSNFYGLIEFSSDYLSSHKFTKDEIKNILLNDINSIYNNQAFCSYLSVCCLTSIFMSLAFLFPFLLFIFSSFNLKKRILIFLFIFFLNLIFYPINLFTLFFALFILIKNVIHLLFIKQNNYFFENCNLIHFIFLGNLLKKDLNENELGYLLKKYQKSWFNDFSFIDRNLQQKTKNIILSRLDLI